MIHVRDLVAALLLAADRGRAAPGEARRYHVSDGFAHRWSAVNDAIAKAVGRRVRVVAVPRAAAVAMALAQSFVARVTGSKPLLTPDRIAELSAADWSCDISRARRELGFEPRVSLAGGMRETAQWYWEQGWL
jgi:nucleoside-diphosphate-sugar epimerase